MLCGCTVAVAYIGILFILVRYSLWFIVAQNEPSLNPQIGPFEKTCNA
jgi:hypothetical protein